ncbi:PhzF family phenazine biosynthesis protein [Sulfurimonas sp.]|jgi:PhzF family phenazine biosynthesis protein|uniref:PhzF family phenazine biosynthesis protein n=1 Tax=Sulfurimonas sp. TaxID=2022749 RepID=UPI002A36A49F|nr:PhzF family phenazine biosynthesis protein [Sulfurimonas sp.]MDY0122693.1 PhzF family phenazine biosynthesis protein [Sulfurimonas sp.]
MNLKIYQIDAFAKTVFEGNPAAVVPLDAWLDDMLMQKIAMENNLSETAYFVKEGAHYRIRWFTPLAEVDMCGHATLSSAFVLFEELGFSSDEVVFESKSGLLRVRKEGARYVMDFPAQELMACDVPQSLQEAFTQKIVACYKAMDYLVVFENEKDILHAVPNMQKLRELDARGVIITAKSAKYDFVCRFFAPKLGIDEDPVTGAAFTQLVPYWSEVLGKKSFHAKQVSARGGEVWCASFGERVQIAGYGVKYLEGVIQL